MKVSENYKANWDKTNQWLMANAPDYVISTIAELADHLIAASDSLLDIQIKLNKYIEDNKPVPEASKPRRWWQIWK